MTEVARIADNDDNAQAADEAQEAEHVLVLGDDVFTCADKLPVTTLIRYADNDLLSMHHILVKLVYEQDHERMWDAFEGLDEKVSMDAITELITSYSERPTGRPGPSRSGSSKTRRK